MHEVKIGCITELECMAKLVKLGYVVSIPYGDCAKYDFIVDINGKLLKIQVKTASEMTNGLGFKFPTKNSKGVSYKNEIDAFMTIFKGEAYIVPIDKASSTEQKLWFAKPNKGQDVEYASEYLLEFSKIF